MVENKMIKASYVHVQSILKSTPSDIHIVEIDGADIQTWEDYSLEIETKMHFPTTCVDSIDRYEDWIRDLEWLNKKGYLVIIYNSSKLMKDAPEIRDIVLGGFEEVVLPWWQSEVEKFYPVMKISPFNVYLVD